ncbi:MAG: hypothetical protein V4694_03880 [Pseudomonadota bacterium]
MSSSQITTKKMTNKFLKSLLAALILLSSLMFAHAAIAQISKSKIQNSEQLGEDPDLKLSIKELRKKYPIGWLKKKYGDSKHPSCGNSDGAFEYEGPIPKNLICSFFTNDMYSKSDTSKLIPSFSLDLEFFSNNQIKSALIEYNNLWKQHRASDDERVREIVILALLTFEEKTNTLTENQKELKNFIYKSQLLPVLQDAIECKYVNSAYQTKITCPVK